MSFQESETFLDQVEEVARAGADAMMPFWRTLKPHEINEKSRNDLVTAADRAAEQAILTEIERRFPDHAVLAEESGWTRRDDDRPTWIVDPLDGTTNFVHGIPQFAVSVGVAVAELGRHPRPGQRRCLPSRPRAGRHLERQTLQSHFARRARRGPGRHRLSIQGPRASRPVPGHLS